MLIASSVRDLLGIPFEMLGLRAAVELPFVEASGAVPRGEKILFSGYCNIKTRPLGP